MVAISHLWSSTPDAVGATLPFPRVDAFPRRPPGHVTGDVSSPPAADAGISVPLTDLRRGLWVVHGRALIRLARLRACPNCGSESWCTAHEFASLAVYRGYVQAVAAKVGMPAEAARVRVFLTRSAALQVRSP